jgi:hypothetical protein
MLCCFSGFAASGLRMLSAASCMTFKGFSVSPFHGQGCDRGAMASVCLVGFLGSLTTMRARCEAKPRRATARPASSD